MRSLRRPVLVKDLTWLLVLLLAALAVRLVGIQRNDRDRLMAWTERQRRSTRVIPARRGLIVDANGRVMAASVQRPSVVADPNRIPNPKIKSDPNEVSGAEAIRDPNIVEAYEAAAAKLAPILGLDERILARDLICRARSRFFWVKRLVTDEEERAVRKLRLRGIAIRYEAERRYPMNERFAHGVGFINREGQALAGLERQYDKYLRGKDGLRVMVADSGRRAIYTDLDEYRAPQDGCHLVLTVDAVIQAVAEQAIAATVEQFRARSGSAIVMVPRTGEVLALANAPTFNLNDYANCPESARCNLAIQAPVEPGSTFKPFIATAALEAKVTWPGDRIFCHNGLYVTGRRRLHDHHPYGTLTFEQVIVKSSNIGMAILGQRLGNERLWSCVRRFGFGRRTGIELPLEDSGIVHPLKRWTSFSTTSIPMGQEMAATPIQLATAFSSLVNGGMLLRPRVIRGIVHSDGTVREDRSAPVVVGRTASKAIARRMAEEVLVRVVKEGTGRRAALEGYQVLGKSGTAQIARADGKGFERDAYVSSFVGAAPAQDVRVLVYVAITRPLKKIGYYGGTVAAPAVREILEKTLAYLGVPPSAETVESVSLARR